MKMTCKNKVGRPKVPKEPKKQSIADFKDDIQIYKNSLIDALDEEEYAEHKETISEFLSMPSDEQNIFIAYLIEGVTITQLAKILKCDRLDVYRIITKTKKKLRK